MKVNVCVFLALAVFASPALGSRFLLQDPPGGNGTAGNETLAQQSGKITTIVLNATNTDISDSTIFAPNDPSWTTFLNANGKATVQEFLGDFQGDLNDIVVPGLFRSDNEAVFPGVGNSTMFTTLSGKNITVMNNGPGQIQVTYPNGAMGTVVKADFNSTATNTLTHIVNIVNGFPISLTGNGTAPEASPSPVMGGQ